ncbi:MAG: carbohydrate kinase family protein [Gaiellales bacterium]
MIALLGQTVRDEIAHPDGRTEVRTGGAPVFAARALSAAGIDGVVVTRGAAALHGDVAAAGLPVLAGPAHATFVSRLVLRPDGRRDHEIAALGTPFTAADVEGWAASTLDAASTIVVGTQWRDDVGPDALRALLRPGRRVVVDAQGLARPGLGVVDPAGPLDPVWLAGVDVVKFSDAEAEALLGGFDAAHLARAGVPIVLVTHGEHGADVWCTGDPAPVRVPARRIPRLADTIGAGDMFTALFAAALDEGDAPVAAAERASAGVADMLALRA